jgi:phosphonate metabolism-associated iron-containing alcohol dehydrogenase
LVLTHPFRCPVACVEGHAFDDALATLIEGRAYVLITSSGWAGRGAVSAIEARCGAPRALIDDIPANPPLGKTCEAAVALRADDVVVALGGGSVLDAAKGMIAHLALGSDDAAFRDHLMKGVPLPAPEAAVYPPLIAVPTTAGTGSEVTRWGTIWGEDGTKYSVTGHGLYPTHAVLDPDLCVSMPRSVTLATGLDALSHAMEAVWNRRHGAATDAMAEQAIRMIRTYLPTTLERPDDRLARQGMQTAAVLAGQAMGTTQSAVAHSISYPFTARYGIPHGIACSFTLAEVIRYNAETDAARLSAIARGFDCSLDALADRVEDFMRDLGIADELSGAVSVDAAAAFGDALITPARAANNIRDVDGAAAGKIATAALRAYLAAGA